MNDGYDGHNDEKRRRAFQADMAVPRCRDGVRPIYVWSSLIPLALNLTT
jgi:hypothetical protein